MFEIFHSKSCLNWQWVMLKKVSNAPVCVYCAQSLALFLQMHLLSVSGCSGLDLCNGEKYFADECFSLLWCTLTRASIELSQFGKAAQFCKTGLGLIKDTKYTRFALDLLADYRVEIKKALAASPSDMALVRMERVCSPGDDLMFTYSVKAPSPSIPAQPEILAVDLDMSMPIDKIFRFIVTDKIREWTQGLQAGALESLAFLVPETRYWVTAIPVYSKEQRIRLGRHFGVGAGHCVDCNIIVLKMEEVDKGPPAVDADAYLSDVLMHAPNCEEMYSRGQKLAA